MKKEKNLSKIIVRISFILYLLLLIWIIVFKFRLDISSLKYIRTINLIPFKANGIVNGMKETLINLVLFIPFGMYLQFITKNKKYLNVIIIFLISLSFEILQYIFHIGVSDITDIIMNTSGGLFGIILMFIFYKLPGKRIENIKLDKILGYLSILIPIVMFFTLFLF